METWVITSLVLSLIGLALWTLWCIKFPARWGYAAAPLSWLIDIALFTGSYVVLSSLGRVDRFLYNTWGAVVQIHGLLLLIGAAAIILVDGRVFLWMLIGRRE